MSPVAYLLPGQGAQAVGMGRAFYDRYEATREVYHQAKARLGFDIAALCFEGPPERLTQTQQCQLALFVTSIAAFAAFGESARAIKVVGVAGLSLGELTALTIAGSLTFSDALYLVQARGEAMAACAAEHRGAMLAVIGLPPEAVGRICEESGAFTANYNSREQLVYSGTIEAIERAQVAAKTYGAKRVAKLDVSGAFHSPLMQRAADQFKQALARIDIRAPKAPFISNVTGEPVQEPEQIRELLVKQIVSAVRWEASMRCLIRLGATHALEFPPARVLVGLLRKIDGAVKGISVNEPEDFELASAALTSA